MRPAGFLVALWEYTQEMELGKLECLAVGRFASWMMRRYSLQHRHPHMLIEPKEARYLLKSIDAALAKKQKDAA